jgi:hypothetical protein
MEVMVKYFVSGADDYDCSSSCHVCFGFAGIDATVIFKVLLLDFLCNNNDTLAYSFLLTLKISGSCHTK